MRFFLGCDPEHAVKFERAMVSVNRLRRRVSDMPANEWMLDSGAFTEVSRHGRFRDSVAVYADQVKRWSRCGRMVAAVSQDFMCEEFVLKITGLTIDDHQRMTIERYDELAELVGDAAYIMPVLQGFWPDEYLRHIRLYGDRLWEGRWAGVGSVCKRNANLGEIEQVLGTIHRERPDLLLHGFGVKTTALASSVVQECLHSADSQAWSRAGRWEDKLVKANAHNLDRARAFVAKIEGQTTKRRRFQPWLF